MIARVRAWLRALLARRHRDGTTCDCGPTVVEAPDDTMGVADAVAIPAHRPKPVRDSVTAHVTFHVLGEWSYAPANLRYRASDPYTVQAVFDTVTWEFARDLLHTAAIERMPAGLADVHLYERDATTLVLALRSNECGIALTVETSAVAAFLRDTYTVVPRGAEAEHMSIDAELVGVFAAEEAL